jgi:hypothetical protein
LHRKVAFNRRTEIRCRASQDVPANMRCAIRTDLRPWRSQIEALLLGIASNPVIRRTLLEAFEKHGLLAYTDLEPEMAADELGRLRRTQVNKALETFDENLRR